MAWYSWKPVYTDNPRVAFHSPTILRLLIDSKLISHQRIIIGYLGQYLQVALKFYVLFLANFQDLYNFLCIL